MRVEAVLLDYGGTLDAPGRHWSTQLYDAFRAAGVTRSRQEVDRAFFASGEGLAADPDVGRLGLAAYVRRQVELMAAHLGEGGRVVAAAAAHFVGAARRALGRSRALLAEQRGRFRLGVVSNFHANLPRILDEVGLAPLLDVVVVSEIVGVRKPDPAIYAHALTPLDLPPGRVAMVGDSLRADVTSAREAGLVAVWLRGDAIFGGGDPAMAHHVAGDLAGAFRWIAGGAPVAG